MIKVKSIGYLLLLLLVTNCYGQGKSYDFVVSKDGDGDFTTVQEAILAVPDFRDKETIVFIKKGVYKEKLVLPQSKTNVTLVGEDVEETILTYDDYASKKNRFGEELGTTGSSSFFLFGDNFTARNITFENSAGDVGQAVALRVDGDKAVFVNCRFLGFQDTLYTHADDSRQYYKDSYIEGATDFIFGSSTAVFDNCEIYCKKGGSYLTAASTPEEKEFGYVIMNSRITGDAPEGSFYLGRPWRSYAQVVVMNSYLGEVVTPEGWHNWGEPEREKTVLYAEYNNEGPGYQPNERVPWSQQLSEEEAAKYTLEDIFHGWNPLERIE
jgi:pectinesterase